MYLYVNIHTFTVHLHIHVHVHVLKCARLQSLKTISTHLGIPGRRRVSPAQVWIIGRPLRTRNQELIGEVIPKKCTGLGSMLFVFFIDPFFCRSSLLGDCFGKKNDWMRINDVSINLFDWM